MGVNPLPNKVDLGIDAWRWEAYLGKDESKNGVRCMVSSWCGIDRLSSPPQAKASANCGMVSEATGENVFRVKRGILSTPPVSAGILRGITRDSVIQLAGDVGVECKRIEISREELYTSDELFLCGTAAELTPVREVDGRKVGEWGIFSNTQISSRIRGCRAR